MITLGIRINPQNTRFALVEFDGTKFKLLNASGETELPFPKAKKKPEEKLEWLYRELDRIISGNSGINRVCFKTNEYRRNGNGSKRMSARLEGVALLLCCQKQISVSDALYNSLKTKRSTVKSDAERLVGRTDAKWNVQMADAVMAAYHAGRIEEGSMDT